MPTIVLPLSLSAPSVDPSKPLTIASTLPANITNKTSTFVSARCLFDGIPHPNTEGYEFQTQNEIAHPDQLISAVVKDASLLPIFYRDIGSLVLVLDAYGKAIMGEQESTSSIPGQQMLKGGDEYRWRNFFSSRTLKTIDSLSKQFLFFIEETGMIYESSGHCNMWRHDEHLVRAVICSDLYLGICYIVNKEESISLKTMEDGQVMLYLNSVIAREVKIPCPWLVFNEKVKVNSVSLRDSIAMSDSLLLLFAGDYFSLLDASGRRCDADQRSELSKVRSGMLEVVAKTIKSSLDELLGFPRTQIGSITSNSPLHFSIMKSSLFQPQMMVVSDLEDLFVPLSDNLLVNWSESRSVVDAFLDSLPSMFQDTTNIESVFGPVLKAAFVVMSQLGERLLIF